LPSVDGMLPFSWLLDRALFVFHRMSASEHTVCEQRPQPCRNAQSPQLAQTAQRRRNVATELVVVQIPVEMQRTHRVKTRSAAGQDRQAETHKYCNWLRRPSSDGILPINWLSNRDLLQLHKHITSEHKISTDKHNAQLQQLAQTAQV
jgi:hypothetical protein